MMMATVVDSSSLNAEEEGKKQSASVSRFSSSSVSPPPEIAAEAATMNKDTAAVTVMEPFSCMDTSTSTLADTEDSITILGEIVGACHLSRDGANVDDHNEDHNNDNNELYPYCKVEFGHQVIHKTKPSVEKGRNPIWTISSGSLFLLKGTPKDFSHNNVRVSVWTKRKDPLQLTTLETCFLGKVDISCSHVLENCNEELLELDLYDQDKHAKGNNNSGSSNKRGSLQVRFRLATPSDQHFCILSQHRPELLKQMSTRDINTSTTAVPRSASPTTTTTTTAAAALMYQPPIATLITEKDEAKLAGTTFVNMVSSAFTSINFFDSSTAGGPAKVRVKPGPDPDRIEETTFLTKQDLGIETAKPSQQWVQAGSGAMGKLYVEILSCDDLPNVDVGEAVGNVTDCFVCAVFEDAMVQTPVIDDELSPQFLPWTQRAFIFGMMHPASMLYIGAFDFDLGLTDHESLGRVAVNISNLQRNTSYTLKYNLYKSSNVTDRTPSGSITIRLRIEYENEKEVLLAALGPRPKFHVNVQKEKSFSVVQYTCFGHYGDDKEEKFDLTVIRSYINELMQYKTVLKYCFSDAFKSLVFWRGQVKVGKMNLPVHSFLFFYFCSVLVERPYLAPPFFLLSIAWMMLAMQTQRVQHPSPWNRCRSFLDYVEVLHHGTSLLSTPPIPPYEGAKEAEAFENEWSDRLEKDQKFAATQAAMRAEITSLGDDSIQTKLAGGIIPLDLLEKLGRYQGMIARYCRYCRFIKIIVTWEESAVSFWITACFLIGGLVSLLLPWAFILLWTGRLVVWGLLGPHMMIVDAYLFAGNKDEGKVLEKAVENFKKQSQTARLRHQEALKLKDVKSLSFGKYITLVPSHNLSRHYDRPLSGSSARVQDDGEEIRLSPHCIPGQQMSGVIIPRNQTAADHHGQELANLGESLATFQSHVQRLEDKDDIDALLQASRDSADSSNDNVPKSEGYELINVDADETSASVDGESSHHVQITQSSSAVPVSCTSPKSPRDPRRSMRVGYEVLVVVESKSTEQSVIPMTESSSLALINKQQELAVVQTEEHARRGSVMLNGFDDERNPVDTLTSTGSATSRDEDADDYGVEIVLGTLEETDEDNEDTESAGTMPGEDDGDDTVNDAAASRTYSCTPPRNVVVFCPEGDSEGEDAMAKDMALRTSSPSPTPRESVASCPESDSAGAAGKEKDVPLSHPHPSPTPPSVVGSQHDGEDETPKDAAFTLSTPLVAPTASRPKGASQDGDSTPKDVTPTLVHPSVKCKAEDDVSKDATPTLVHPATTPDTDSHPKGTSEVENETPTEASPILIHPSLPPLVSCPRGDRNVEDDTTNDATPTSPLSASIPRDIVVSHPKGEYLKDVVSSLPLPPHERVLVREERHAERKRRGYSLEEFLDDNTVKESDTDSIVDVERVPTDTVADDASCGCVLLKPAL